MTSKIPRKIDQKHPKFDKFDLNLEAPFRNKAYFDRDHSKLKKVSIFNNFTLFLDLSKLQKIIILVKIQKFHQI